jgi:hypothetical protein
MSTAVKNPPVKVKVNVGVPKTLPRGTAYTIAWSMFMSAVCYFLTWAVGESKTAKVARLWRLRAAMARTSMRLQSDVTSAYLNGKCGNGDKEIDQNSPLLKRWVSLVDEYQSVFVELEVDSILNRKPPTNPVP